MSKHAATLGWTKKFVYHVVAILVKDRDYDNVVPLELHTATLSSDSVGGYVFMQIVGICCGWASGRLVIRYMQS